MADIGPLAVSASHQGRGLGSRILTRLEAEPPVTGVGVVSCRSDILPWYDKRGYVTCGMVKLDKVMLGVEKLELVLRRCRKMEKQFSPAKFLFLDCEER